MSFLDEHEAGCRPLSKPCRTCRAVSFLKANLKPDKFDKFCKLIQPGSGIEVVPHTERSTEELNTVLDKSIDELTLNTRAFYALRNDGYSTYRDLVTKSEFVLRRIPNFGKKSLNEVKESLAMDGLWLGMPIPEKEV